MAALHNPVLVLPFYLLQYGGRQAASVVNSAGTVFEGFVDAQEQLVAAERLHDVGAAGRYFQDTIGVERFDGGNNPAAVQALAPPPSTIGAFLPTRVYNASDSVTKYTNHDNILTYSYSKCQWKSLYFLWVNRS